MDGLQDIRLARLRHIGAGYTPEHDDEHTKKELVHAAATLTLGYPHGKALGRWPWSEEDYQRWATGPESTTQDRIRELAEAGALIAAEIDRLRRKGGSTP